MGGLFFPELLLTIILGDSSWDYTQITNNNNNNNNKKKKKKKKEAEKKLRYKNLSIEIQRMWNMKCFVTPVIIGATGIVSKSLQKIWKQYQDNTQ
jgi:fructose-1,6-bisphosphatase/sedoheptulose 1,7-bisphosphatase-like protein